MNSQNGRRRWSDEKLLARALSAKTLKTYWNNIGELRGRASPSLFDRCTELTRSDIPAERTAGVDILAQLFVRHRDWKKIRYPYRAKALQIFLQMLANETDTDTLISILHGIGHTNQRLKTANIGSIIPFTYSQDPNIRFAALSALSGVENMKALDCLIALAKDKSSRIRNWATFGIGTLSDLDTPAIRNILYERCNDRHHDTRMEAIYGLAKRKDSRVKKYLEKELTDCTVYVLQSIEALNAEEYLPHLKSLLEETQNDPHTNQYWLGHLQRCIKALQDDGSTPASPD